MLESLSKKYVRHRSTSLAGADASRFIRVIWESSINVNLDCGISISKAYMVIRWSSSVIESSTYFSLEIVQVRRSRIVPHISITD